MPVTVTVVHLDERFDGVMIEVEGRPKPGWKCKVCGWKCVTDSLPWAHECKGKTVVVFEN